MLYICRLGHPGWQIYKITYTMFKNFIKTTLRSLVRDKYYSLINISGLAIGLAVTILIILFIFDELTYDRFHALNERIYRLESDFTLDNKHLKAAVTQIPLGPTLKDEYPEIEEFTRCLPIGTMYLRYGDKDFQEDSIWYADSTFFRLFTHYFIYGDPNTALAKPNTMVVTKNFAERYFGDRDPIGESVTTIENQILQITGVIEDLPGNAHLKFNGLISAATIAEQIGAERFNDRSAVSFWNINVYSYVLVNENSDIQNVLDKFPAFYDKYMKEVGDQIRGDFDLMVTPLADIHLNPIKLDYDLPKGNRSTVYIFAMAALFILLIACINYMNMATARSARRAKEVGLRKVTGAHKHLLISQFLGESVIITIFSFIISVVLVRLLLPLFNDLSAKQLSFGIVSSTGLFCGTLLIAVIVGLLAGSYPAFYLSSFRPMTVLKGTVEKTGGKAYLRKGLVLVQFAISVIMIIGTMAVSRQLKFMRTTDLGFDKDNIIVMTVRDTTLRKSYESFKEELLTHPDILAAAVSTSTPGRELGIQVARMEGDSGAMIEKAINNFFMDYDYLDMMGMKIIDGRNYERERGTDPTKALIINETAVRELGWTGAPLGKRFQWGINLDGTANRDGEITGVVKDYHFRSLHNKIEPLVLLLAFDTRFMPLLNIRTSGKNQQAVLDFIDQKRKEFGDQYPFDYSFLNEDLDNYYQEEAIIGKIFRYFTIITIFIASLGLLGLSAFLAQQRTKEIGIRKVVGSSVNNIILLFLKDITTWVLIANVIGMVIAWFGIDRWLQAFQYRIDITAWLFLSGLAISLVVAWITVTWQSVKASLANPAVSLRYE